MDAARLEREAMTAVAVPLHYAQSGRNLAWAALAGARNCVEFRHYPRNDLIDEDSGTRFFYHAHPTPQPEMLEHGHFHLFRVDGKRYHHLAALSLDAQGRPLRWFTTNQWVTGEQWSKAGQWRKRLPGFCIRTRGRLAPLAEWLTAMVHLYQDELLSLIEARDAVLAQALASRKRSEVWNDQSLHILSQTPISLEAKVRSLLNASPTIKEESC